MSNIRDKAMLVRLKVGTWGGYKTDRNISREVAYSKRAFPSDSGSYTKKLMGRGDGSELTSTKNAITALYQRLSLPWEDTGFRILPTRSFLKYAEEIRNAKRTFFEAKERFKKNFHTIKESGKRRLGEMYREEDYPTMEELDAKIYFHTSIMSLPGTTDFRLDLPEEEMREVQMEATRAERNLTKGVIQECCKRMYTPLRSILEKVEAFDDKWQASTLENLGAIAQSMEILNITKDPTVTKIAREISEKIVSQHPYDIKNRTTTRNAVLETGIGLLEAMEGIRGE